MALSGRGSSPEDTLTLKALQTGVATAVENSGLTPPVLVAHSMAVSQYVTYTAMVGELYRFIVEYPHIIVPTTL